MPLTEAEANCSKNVQIGVQVCGSSFKAYMYYSAFKTSHEKNASALAKQYLMLSFHIGFI